jgi:hypothetical protein
MAEKGSNETSQLPQHGDGPITAAVNETNRNKLLSIWQSPSSSPEEKVHAINSFISPGSDVGSVQELLGDGILVRYHGPSLNIVDGTNRNAVIQTGTHDYLQLEYRTSSRVVVLRFYKLSAPADWQFGGAALARVLDQPAE